MAENKHYRRGFDGMPTAPDVAALRQRWPELHEGDEIPYEQITAVIGHTYTDQRFHRVVDAWAKVLQGEGLVLAKVPGEAVRVLTHEQAIYGLPDSALRFTARKYRRTRGKVQAVQPTDQRLQDSRMHAVRLLQVNEEGARKARQELLTLPAADTGPWQQLRQEKAEDEG